tara:strand:- start:104 stop:409 length:306 start_codon:yes stop_codon:yes gene_type:complete
MSYKWPPKDKDETLDYSVDWSRFLGTDTLSSASWKIDGTSVTAPTSTVNELNFLGPTISGQVATARFSGGTNHRKYTITCTIISGSGLTFERSIILRIAEK